jgi:Kef-type K+ transport system membrane component KefB
MELLISLGLLLIISKLLEVVAMRLRQSALIAYVAAGIILGPALGLVEATDELKLFFGIGVVFLFFLIGVEEMDVSGMAATIRGRFFLAGILAFLVSFGFAIAVMLIVLEDSGSLQPGCRCQSLERPRAPQRTPWPRGIHDCGDRGDRRTAGCLLFSQKH